MTTTNYTRRLFPEDVVYTIEEFKEECKTFSLTDYDGYGYPVKDNKAATSFYILPSRLYKIPNDATHIVWFNK